MYLLQSVKACATICTPIPSVIFLDIYKFLNITMYKTREGLIEEVYLCLTTNTPLDSIHIPHSDVFFVREALEARFQCELSLLQVEEYMKEAGWRDSGDTRTSEEQDEGVRS